MDPHRGFRSSTGSFSNPNSQSDCEPTPLGTPSDSTRSRIPETPPDVGSSSQPTGSQRKRRPNTANIEKTWPKDEHGRLRFLRDERGVLLESPGITKSCTTIFRRTFNPTGVTWKKTPQSIIDSFWEDFKKEYQWEAADENEVYKMWKKKAQKGFSDTLSDLKMLWLEKGDSLVRPEGFSPEFWDNVRAHWASEEVKAMSRIKRANRLSEPDGPGTGISKHSGGSRSARIAAQTLASETGLSRDQLSYELFLAYHKKEDGSYTTPRDANIDAKIHQIAVEQGRSDLNNIYMEVCHPHKSRRYGSGSEGESQLSRGSVTSSPLGGLSQEMFRAQLSTLEERLKKAEEDRAAEQQAREAERQAREAQQQAFEAMQRQMAMFEQYMRASGQFPPPDQPPP